MSTFEVLREMPCATLRIRGACMAPFLEDGATITVRARRFYFPGDVIVFRTPAGDLAAHRMLGWRRAAIVTKGDSCEIHDAPVSADAIIGAADVRVSLGDRVNALLAFGGIVLRRLVR